MNIPTRLALALLLALTIVTGCASRAAFDTTFPLTKEHDLHGLLARMHAAPGAPQLPVVVGVRQQPRGVFAFDLSAQRLLFSQEADVSGKPLAAGPYAVVPEGEKLRLRRLSDGSVVREIEAAGMHLIGADGDGSVTALVLSTGGSYAARSRLVIVRGEEISANLLVEQTLGAPAVQGGLVFVPHGRVHLSVLSAEGQELARVRIRDDVASEARSNGRDVYFGQAGVYKLDEQTPAGVNGGAHYFAPDVARRRKLPGSPELLHDTTLDPPALDSAVHRIALGFWPETTSDGVSLANDALYLSFYRTLFALTADASGAHWVRATPSDIVGMGGHSAGVVAVEERGVVSAFDREGDLVLEAQLGLSPLLASVRAEGLSAEGSGEALPSLSAQLRAAALHDDTRLVPAGELALQLLARLPDEEASSLLIEICSKSSLTRRIRDSACELLGGRKDGVDSVLVALARHSDYLRDEPAPPLAPLSKAAATAGDQRAAPLLLAHLEDPSTDPDDLPVLMASLTLLGDTSVVPAVARFLKLYHADAANGSLGAALVLATQLLAKLAPELAAGTLEAIASDGLGDGTVREAARKELAKLPRNQAEQATADEVPSEAAPSRQLGRSAPSGARAEKGEAPAEQGAKARLTADDLAHALAPLRAEITDCVQKGPGHPASARLTVVVEPDGSLLTVRTLPDSLLGCVEPLVRRAKLPATSFAKRDTLHQTITR